MMTSRVVGLRREKKLNKVHSLIFVGLISIAYIVPDVMYFALLLAIFIVYAAVYKTKIHKGLRNQVVLLGSIAIPGLFFVAQNEDFNSLKDVWYLLKSVICILCGYLIVVRVRNPKILIGYFIWSCFFICIVYLFRFFTVSDEVAMDAAYSAGLFPSFCCVGLALAIKGRGVYGFESSRLVRYMVIAVMVTALVFSFSRTLQGVFVIFLFALFGFFDSLKRLAICVGLLALLGGVLSYALPEYNANDPGFLGKIKNSFTEVSFVQSYSDQEIATNWRGFEASKAQNQFESVSTLEKVFGQGLGATVDLGFYVYMGEGLTYRYLPILHNGYYHILTKYGVLGLLLYALFVMNLVSARSFFILGVPDIQDSTVARRLIIGLGVTLVFTTLTITGALNKVALDGLLFLMGAVYALHMSSRRKSIEFV